MTKEIAFQRAKAFVGAKVKDTINGFVGKCTAVAIYDKEFDTIRVQVEHDDKNGFLQSMWFDHTRLEIVKEADEE